MRLMLSQNIPFTPIYDAWTAHAKGIPELDLETVRMKVKRMSAPVLANRKPPYALAGGLYSALVESGGAVCAITNEQARCAARIFAEAEGIDIEPAAAVALASLLQAVRDKVLPPSAITLLNLTGGGRARYWKDHSAPMRDADLRVSLCAVTNGSAAEKIALTLHSAFEE
jgi:cysteate synthase